MESHYDKGIKQVIQPRNPVNAAILSFFAPGVGQVYNGQPVKGIVFLAAYMMVTPLFGLTRAVTVYSGLVIFVLLKIALLILFIIDAVKNANRQQDYIPKPYNTWYYHLIMVLCVLCFSFFLNRAGILGITPLKIPTTANEPNLHVDDYVMADMQAYENEKPDYGHLVVFENEKGVLLLYRVIGLPGDKVRMQHNYPIINRKPCNVYFFSRYVSDPQLPKAGIIEQAYTEQLPNDYKHLVVRRYKTTNPHANDSVAHQVPEGCYFLLGDNRDCAADSRYIGPVKKEAIKGRIVYAYWSRRSGLGNRSMK